MIQEKYLHSLITTYRKQVWSPFTKAIRDYDLIEKDDHIAVCISGGKDSFLLAICLEELRRYSDVPFTLTYLCLDPGYDKESMDNILENAKEIGIELKIVPAVIFRYVETLDQKPCYICARMRRGHLYQAARELGCNKIALGHHYDDVIETILMSIMYSGQTKTMLPKLPSRNFEGLSLIRPFYLVEEKGIINYWNHHKREFIHCACTLEKKGGESASKRKEVKNLIEEYSKKNPFLKQNLFRSVQEVNLETILSYKDETGIHSILDEDEENKI